MNLLLSTALLSYVVWGSVQQPENPSQHAVCKGVTVSLSADVSRVKVGERPFFSVAVSNGTERPVRVLDVRDGRRPDLQDSYFEIFVIRETKAVNLPVAISDPGPLSPTDFIELEPGSRVAFQRISYKRALENLPAGAYEAFILFWRDPMESHTTRCRSTSAQFTVYE